MPYLRLALMIVLSLQAAVASAQVIEPSSNASRRSTAFRALENQLFNTTVSIDWEGRTLAEALVEFRDQLGINLVVSSSLKDSLDEEIDLRLIDITAYTVLGILAREFDIGFLQRGRSLIAMPRADLMKRSFRLRVYDVRSMLYTPPDFPGPQLGLRVGPGIDEEPGPTRVEREREDPESILDLIREATGASMWEIEGASLQLSGGLLVVRHAPSMQRQVKRMLYLLGL